MLYDPNDFSFLKNIISKVDILSNEYLEAYNKIKELKEFFKDGEMPPVYSHFDYWVRESGFDHTQIGYDARGANPVGGFPLYKKGFPIKWMDVPSVFPGTHELLMEVKNIHFAQYAIMAPGSHILPHKHTTQGSFIFHINLFDLSGESVFIAGNERTIIKKKGDCFIFNPIDEHESINSSKSYRINLMIDFRPDNTAG